jgi:hypothetical protein
VVEVTQVMKVSATTDPDGEAERGSAPVNRLQKLANQLLQRW